MAQVLGGGFWAKAMALSIALSVIATTGTGIVLGARIVYGMASYRVLPEFLGNVSRRFATPVAASVVVGLLIVILSAVYYLATSVQNAFFDVIDVTGLLFSIFYILTALAAIVYYRRRIVSGAVDFVHARRAAARRGRLPRLDLRQVAGRGAVEPALVAHRHRHRRAGRDGFRTVLPAFLVLPAPPGERSMTA